MKRIQSSFVSYLAKFEAILQQYPLFLIKNPMYYAFHLYWFYLKTSQLFYFLAFFTFSNLKRVSQFLTTFHNSCSRYFSHISRFLSKGWIFFVYSYFIEGLKLSLLLPWTQFKYVWNTVDRPKQMWLVGIIKLFLQNIISE